jgi:hypothetical protein
MISAVSVCAGSSNSAPSISRECMPYVALAAWRHLHPSDPGEIMTMTMTTVF